MKKPHPFSTTWLALAVLTLLASLGGAEARKAKQYTLTGRLVVPETAGNVAWRVLAAPRLYAELPTAGHGPQSVTPEADGKFVLRGIDGGQQYVCAYVNGRLDVDSVVPVRLSGDDPPPPVTLKPKSPREQVERSSVGRRDLPSPPPYHAQIHIETSLR